MKHFQTVCFHCRLPFVRFLKHFHTYIPVFPQLHTQLEQDLNQLQLFSQNNFTFFQTYIYTLHVFSHVSDMIWAKPYVHIPFLKLAVLTNRENLNWQLSCSKMVHAPIWISGQIKRDRDVCWFSRMYQNNDRRQHKERNIPMRNSDICPTKAAEEICYGSDFHIGV